MLANILVIAYAAIAVLCILTYIPKLRQLFWYKKRIPHKIASKRRKISVVIPARDESGIITDLLNSIAVQDYARDCFDVNVIVNDANDPTVEIAKSFGANVFVVTEQTCKGEALDGYFKQIGADKIGEYASFVIVDADAVLPPDYLTELNNALEYDTQIVLTRKHIKNFLGERKDRTIYSNCSALTYAQLDDLGNIYRTEKGIPMNMCGQGMMVRSDVIKELGGWPYRTLTEDYEMRMDCYLKGFTSMYYPYAIIYTEEPLTHKENYMRRLRWVTGFSQCDKMYKKRIKAQAKERGKATEGEIEYFYSLAPIIAFIVLTIVTILCGTALTVYNAISGAASWLYSLLLNVVLPLGVMYLFLVIYAIMCITAMSDAFATIPFAVKLATVLYAPLNMLEYFPIFIHSKINARRGWDWKPTRHIRYKGGVRTKSKKKNDGECSDATGEDVTVCN